MQIDLRVMELLASKICHDLASPVSAINNGVELIEDIGGSVVEEAMKLIGDSGITASRRVKLFRMAYGRAGSEESIAIKDVRQTAEQYLSSGKVSLIWPENVPSAETAEQRGFLKTLLNLIILSEESLAYGGVVTLRGGENGCRIEVAGRNAQLNPQIQEALAGDTPIENLSPRSIQAYMTGRFASHFGLKLSHGNSVPDHLEMVLSFKIQEIPAALVNVS